MLAMVNFAYTDDGYRLWLKYDLISGSRSLKEYKNLIHASMVKGESATIQAAMTELQNGLNGLLGSTIPQVNSVNENGIIMAGSFQDFPLLQDTDLKSRLMKVGDEGFVISDAKVNGKKVIVITANQDIGVLYGVFHFLKLLQTNQDVSTLNIVSSPKIKLRMLNHWDNLDGTRVYPGFSIWDWHTLPQYIKRRYIDYARANASIGINGVAPTNVNAEPLLMTHEYLVKVAALVDVFRPLWDKNISDR
jgi:alpha-glucuronidase